MAPRRHDGERFVKVAIAVFEGFTALDAIGPYEVLRNLPGAECVFVAGRTGVVRTDTGVVGLHADATFDEVDRPDIVVIPGGPGTRHGFNDALIDWAKRVHETTQWTTSVCTGSLLLGAAGILTGLRATSHWMALDQLPSFGAEPTLERVVVQGKVITAAGVSSGIDMALTLAALIAGDEAAQAIQLGIEYDPQPPFDAGSPEKAPPEVVELVRSLMAPGMK
jgi:putative intracellular protease/amidase